MVQRVLLVQVQLWKTEGLLFSMPLFTHSQGSAAGAVTLGGREGKSTVYSVGKL